MGKGIRADGFHYAMKSASIWQDVQHGIRLHDWLLLGRSRFGSRWVFAFSASCTKEARTPAGTAQIFHDQN
jgi:hypothetical protein